MTRPAFEKGDVIRKMPGEINIMSGEDKSRPHGLKLLRHGGGNAPTPVGRGRR